MAITDQDRRELNERMGPVRGRSLAMLHWFDQTCIRLFGRTFTEAQVQKICIKCATPVKVGGEDATFTTALAEREYRIGGMCEACQDALERMFGGE